ncbi:hypothetical protein K432DRAFT_301307, partial [Lepidopterella palustris CBS 459.81]
LNPADKPQITHWTLDQFYTNSLNPFVTPAETAEYSRYISHPLNLPLVTTTEQPSASDPAALDFFEYISLGGTGGGEGYKGEDATTTAVPGEGGGRWEVSEEDVEHYAEFLTVVENPLDVGSEDWGKKRYKAYRQWLRGKSLFKQSKVDPEYQMQGR